MSITAKELVARGACVLLGHRWEPRWLTSWTPIGYVCPCCRAVRATPFEASSEAPTLPPPKGT